MDKYKVGDKVKVKEWDDLVKEFGTFHNGIIKTCPPIIEDMKKFCGNTYTVSGFKDGGGKDNNAVKLEGCGNHGGYVFPVQTVVPVETAETVNPAEKVEIKKGDPTLPDAQPFPAEQKESPLTAIKRAAIWA